MFPVMKIWRWPLPTASDGVRLRSAPTDCVISNSSRCATRLRLLVAAGLAMILLSASLAIDWWDGLSDDETTMAMSASRRHFG
ncbi:hypothetical protein [Bradyrhizobium sp. I71]|uniref:hypothetical protein n=1 Tax=Bradyrhizobium sp. I71 TaxID=2590772 RepID=UPI001EF88445|nr:hypothetical protein [Bradyrhizobium sp. I71]ULL00072.1 hypothetical protein FJV43_10175 [Bradyrhizobium sp. I71]